VTDVTEQERQAILREMVELTTPEFRQPDDFTIKEFIAEWNETNAPHSITIGGATRWLVALVRDEKLVKVENIYDSVAHRHVCVYRKVG